MKYYNINTSAVVNFARLPKAERYVQLATGGVKYYAHCTAEEFIAAGYLPYTEIPAPAYYTPGQPRLTIGETTVVLDYPNAVLDEDAQLNASLTAVDVEYAGKLLTVSSAIVTCFANDGGDMETRLSELRADYQSILAARDAAFNALFGEE